MWRGATFPSGDWRWHAGQALVRPRTAAFPGLTSLGVELAFEYARRHELLVEKLLESKRRNSAVAGSGDETDDASDFEVELDTLLDRNADVFRRLAQ